LIHLPIRNSKQSNENVYHSAQTASAPSGEKLLSEEDDEVDEDFDNDFDEGWEEDFDDESG
jgi:hypothetical protein